VNYLLDTNIISEIRKRDRAHPNVARWVDSVSARPAVKSMLAKIAELQAKSSRERATDKHKDRFFGRGEYARA